MKDFLYRNRLVTKFRCWWDPRWFWNFLYWMFLFLCLCGLSCALSYGCTHQYLESEDNLYTHCKPVCKPHPPEDYYYGQCTCDLTKTVIDGVP